MLVKQRSELRKQGFGGFRRHTPASQAADELFLLNNVALTLGDVFVRHLQIVWRVSHASA